MLSLATNRSDMTPLSRTSRPVPTDRVTSLPGATAPAGWATAWPGAEAARAAASAAASAVPIEARFILLLLIILSGSHRNKRDCVAAGDADDRTERPIAGNAARGGAASRRRGIIAFRPRTARDGAALEAGDVGADREGGVAVDRAAGDDEQHMPLGAGLGIGRSRDLARGDRPLELGIVVGERAQRQRQLADGLCHRDLLGDLRGRLERHRGGALRDLVAMLVAGVEALIDGEHPDVADDRLGGAQRRPVAAALDLLGQDEIDTVAGKHETRNAAGRGDGNRDRAHPRAQCRGEEAALAGADDGALGQRLAGGDLVADHGAHQALRLGAAAAADE